MGTKRTLLLVDDEENILKSLSRTLRRDDYKIYTADGGEAGLEILANHDVGVVVSDQRMPGMSGSEFLNRAREHYPDSIRIMLSGYTELRSVTNAINHGNIFKFLSKPWEDDLLRTNIKEAFLYYELLQKNKKLSNDYLLLNKDLERRVEERTRELLLSMHRLKQEQYILESLPCCVIGLDNDDLVVNANNYAYELFDRDRSGLIGKNARHILPSEIVSCVKQADTSEVNEEISIDNNRLLVSIKNLSKLASGAGKVIACTLLAESM